MESNTRIHRHSAPEDKIALFRSLFRGREDVYPRRFESRKTGKTGEAVPAALARQLGSHILTETMERRPDVGLDSYDRFFPNQDTLPQGGFGSLIALPFQKKPRQLGNTEFLDDRLSPYGDQWTFLS